MRCVKQQRMTAPATRSARGCVDRQPNGCPGASTGASVVKTLRREGLALAVGQKQAATAMVEIGIRRRVGRLMRKILLLQTTAEFLSGGSGDSQINGGGVNRLGRLGA